MYWNEVGRIPSKSKDSRMKHWGGNNGSEGNNLILINPRPSVLVINYLVVETWDFIRSEFQCTDGRATNCKKIE